MMLFVLSLVMLAFAPALFFVVQRLGRYLYFVERTFFFGIAGLVLVHIVPQSFAVAGWWAFLMLALGWLAPTLFEKTLRPVAAKVHMVPIVLSILGLVVHGLFDGVALSFGEHAAMFAKSGSGLHVHALPLAIVVHRIPASLFIWWVLYPKYGAAGGVGGLTLLGITTCVGFWSGSEYFMELDQGFEISMFESLVAGSLLHLAFHQAVHDDEHDHHHHHH